MPLVEECGHLPDGVPVPGHHPGGGEAHGDDAPRHVRQVEVHAVLLVAALVLKLVAKFVCVNFALSAHFK